jgi:hypothetical protein
VGRLEPSNRFEDMDVRDAHLNSNSRSCTFSLGAVELKNPIFRRRHSDVMRIIMTLSRQMRLETHCFTQRTSIPDPTVSIEVRGDKQWQYVVHRTLDSSSRQLALCHTSCWVSSPATTSWITDQTQNSQHGELISTSAALSCRTHRRAVAD